MDNEFYVYKGTRYDYPPIKDYIVISSEVYPTYTIKHIRKRVSLFIHVVFLSIIVGIVLSFVYNVYTISNSLSKSSHKVYIPSSMYYDRENNILDIDIINDIENIGISSVSIYDAEDNTVVSVYGIYPGDIVGGLEIKEYSFDELPTFCTVKYIYSDDSVRQYSYEKKVLIVDKESAEKEFNNDF